MSHLVLIDGHHMMYRAYWAIPRTLKTSGGEQVNTVFGMASMLISILSKEEPTELVVCFDEGEDTFRHQEHEEYKAGRAETPDDFYVQIPRVIELIDACGFSHVSDPHYEADDLLGAYAKAGEDAGMRVTIVSGDRDVLQLVSERISVAIPHKGYQDTEYLGPQEVQEKLGITPEQVVDYKGLCGDSSDNLPGVQGIGPKTASALLQQYGSLEEVYANIGDIKSSWQTKLVADREQAFFCQRMARLETAIPLPLPLEDCSLRELPVSRIFDFFRTMEFSLLSKRFQEVLKTEYGLQHSSPSDREAMEQGNELEKEKKEQLTLF